MQDAVARLSADQRELVQRCISAALHGPYLDDDDEFEAIMGITRDELAETLAAWPKAAAHGSSVYAVSNALNNLLGYPHGQWRQLSRELEATEQEVAEALAAWTTTR